MTLLTTWSESGPETLVRRTSDPAEIAEALKPLGVRYEQWPVREDVPFDADSETVFAAYGPEIDKLNAEEGFTTVDVLGLHPSDDPEFPFIRRDKVTHAVDTTWYYVHKPDVAAMHAQASKPLRLRCEANQPCPREGWWVTPAKLGSRRHFKQGEVMPAFKTDWGLTIWQWDDNNQST